MNNNKGYGRAVRRPSDTSPSRTTADSTRSRTYSPARKISSPSTPRQPRANAGSRPGVTRSSYRPDSARRVRATRGESAVYRNSPRRAATHTAGAERSRSTRNTAARSSAPVLYGREARLVERTDRQLRRLEKKEQRLVAAELEWQSEVERVRGGVDKVMLVIILILLALGTLIIYSASYPIGISSYDDGMYYLKRHLLFMLLGGAAMFVASYVPYTWYKKWFGFALYALAAVLLVVAAFAGGSDGTAVSRWISIGPVRFQPSEIMKIALVMLLAWYLDKYADRLKSHRTVGEKIELLRDKRRGAFSSRVSKAFPRNGGTDKLGTYLYNTFFPLCIVGGSCLLVLIGKHLSGTVIVGVIGLAVMLVAGCHVAYTVLTTLAVGVPVVAVYLMSNAYALQRVLTFTSDNADTLAEKWQATQGALAIGSGGLFGVGFAESRQKFGYVSEPYNDFIFSIWCEEFGFIGAALLIGLFVAFIWRGCVIAMRAPDKYSMLLAFGITTQVGVQAVLNMMVVCGVLPTTGVSLPFISYGGTALAVLMAEMGVLLSISRRSYRKTA